MRYVENRQCADSGAYYAVAIPSRHRRLTSLAALDGGLYGEKLWGRVKVSRSHLHMFTCQNFCAARVPRLQLPAQSPELPRISQQPSSPPSPLHVTRSHHGELSSASFDAVCHSVGFRRFCNTTSALSSHQWCPKASVIPGPSVVCIARAPLRICSANLSILAKPCVHLATTSD